ncbi:MAG: hypothetical protein LBB16_02815 [Puniceicoccales bacterium]|jgi:hypothetical protein|nr:hypothetical protein [Puniceicoccales bacterium]
MKIRTSDGKVLDNFERLNSVIDKTREFLAIKQAAKSERDGEITYDGHQIRVNDSVNLAARISNVLNNMSLCSWNGEIYANGEAVFQSEFAKCLNFLLTWLRDMRNIPDGDDAVKVVGVTAFEMQSIFEWIKAIIEECESQYSESDVASVESTIGQF